MLHVDEHMYIVYKREILHLCIIPGVDMDDYVHGELSERGELQTATGHVFHNLETLAEVAECSVKDNHIFMETCNTNSTKTAFQQQSHTLYVYTCTCTLHVQVSGCYTCIYMYIHVCICTMCMYMYLIQAMVIKKSKISKRRNICI